MHKTRLRAYSAAAALALVTACANNDGGSIWLTGDAASNGEGGASNDAGGSTEASGSGDASASGDAGGFGSAPLQEGGSSARDGNGSNDASDLSDASGPNDAGGQGGDVASSNDSSGPATGLCTSSVNGGYALPADRATTWHLAGMLSKGGIASASWPTCNSTPLIPSGGDDTTLINNAISSCASGTVVTLGPGTFKMGQGKYIAISKGVVLRGAGAGVTILKNPLNVPATQSSQAAADGTPIVIIGPGRWVNPDGDARCNGPTAYQTAYMQLLSADGAKGSSSVTVASGSLFGAGQFVLLDETTGGGWQPDISGISTSVWASPDYAVQWTLHNPAASVDDLSSLATPSAANNWAGIGNGKDAACWFGRQDRPQSEMKEVASVNGNTVTFTSPLHKTYRVSSHAELTTFTGGNRPVVNAGIENLTVVGGGSGAVLFNNAAYSWAKNVEVTIWYGEGVAFWSAFRSELRDSYIHDAAWAEPGGAGYAISIGGSSELLIENNISIKANKVMVARSSGAGSVVGYNYMDDGYIATSEGWIEIGANASHMVGSHHVLFEGNETFNLDSDDTHGNSTYHTYFRNWSKSVRAKFQSGYTGNTIDDATQTGNGPKRAAGAMRYTYWMSFVGNVLGQSGLTNSSNGYVDDSADWVNHGRAIWLLGWNDISPYTVDPKVASTAIRDGNWDSYLGKQTWLTASAATLANSCYLTSKPAFFGSNPWPWVDPTTGAVHVLPAQARYAAGTPNTVP